MGDGRLSKVILGWVGKNCHRYRLTHNSPSLRCGGLHREIILESELHIGVTLIATLLHFYRQA